MKKDYVTIGQFCKETGISPSKLRFYESLGLIQPALVDEKNGYHYYSYKQYAEIEIIQICRKLNFPIKKIRDIQKSNNRQMLLELITKQKFHARKSLLQQQEIYNNLSWLYDTWEQEILLHENSDIKPRLQTLPQRTVLIASLDKEGYPDSPIQQANELQCALSKRTISEQIAVNSVQRVYGYQLDTDAFLQNQIRLIVRFVELPQYIMTMKNKLTFLPAGDYITFPTAAFSDQNWVSELNAYLQNNSLKAKEIYMTEVALPLLRSDDAFYIIQIHIDKNK